MGILAWLKRLFTKIFGPSSKPESNIPAWVGKQFPFGPDQKFTVPVPALEDFVCPHGPKKGKVSLTVMGITVELRDPPMCPECSEVFLNQASTICATCGDVILPGTTVAVSWDGAKYPFTHVGWECCAAGAFFCGIWGNGRLIPLHELYPEQFPQDTGTIAAHTFETGQGVAGNLP